MKDQELQAIYLMPDCPGCADATEGGRLWCEDPQDPCEECGKKWLRYVLDKRQNKRAKDGQS